MNLYTFLYTNIFIFCIIFILLVLIQSSNEEEFYQKIGMDDFPIFGIKNTNNFLENFTWFLSFVIFILIIISNYFLYWKKNKDIKISI
jgi:protein translocase SecG subunit